MGTDQVDKVDFDEFKAKNEGASLLPRIGYRKNVMGVGAK